MGRPLGSVLGASFAVVANSALAEPPASAPAVGEAACVVGPHPRELDAWANEMTRLVCDGLRRQGIAVGAPAPNAGAAKTAYVVTVDRLGSTLSILATYEKPPGVTARMLWTKSDGPDESKLAAESVATAFTASTSPLDVPVDRGLLVQEPARHYQEWRFGAGAGLLALPEAEPQPLGLLADLTFASEGVHWGFVFRGALGTNFSRPTLLAEISAGPRYYTGERNTSLFLGAGLTYMHLAERAGKDTTTGEGFCLIFCNDEQPGKVQGAGFGAYAEFGIVFRRLRRSPFALSLRADPPFFELSRQAPDTNGLPYTPTGSTSRYDVPIVFTFSQFI